MEIRAEQRQEPISQPDRCLARDVEEILANGKVQTFFQPLVSVPDKGVLGFEAYARGVVSDRSTVIKPRELFDACRSADTQLRIDRICRRSALEKFQSIYAAHRNMLLFLNINATALKSELVVKGTLGNAVRELGYDPGHVVIELQSDRIDMEDHADFITYYKTLGFAFSLDDFRAADLEKLHLVRPDFVKIGRPSFTALRDHAYKKELLTSLRRTAAELGCRIAAKGVETEEEAFLLLDNKVHLQQGFYFTKKKEDTGQDASQIFQEKIRELHARYRDRVTQAIQDRRALFERYNQTTLRLLHRFEKAPVRFLPEELRIALQASPEVLAAFVLDEHGHECGNRLVRVRLEDKSLLREIHNGQDHSIQDYFLHLQMGFERFVTGAFFSPHDRSRRCLIARRYFNAESRALILCLEFPAADDPN